MFAILLTVVLAACSGAPNIDETSRDLSVSSTSLVAAAQASSSSDATKRQLHTVAGQISAANDPLAEGYKIGPQDVLQVSVFNVPELSKAVAVAESGTINYPLIGETRAAGWTARDLERSLAQSLGAKYLQNPQVSVMVTKFNSQRITIEGAVRKPGIYPLLGSMSLLQLIATAEGLTDGSNDNVIVFRHINGQRTAARFSIPDIRTGQSADPKLAAGDVVVANASASKKLFNNILKAMPVAGLFALL